MDLCLYCPLIAQGQRGAPVIQADLSPCSQCSFNPWGPLSLSALQTRGADSPQKSVLRSSLPHSSLEWSGYSVPPVESNTPAPSQQLPPHIHTTTTTAQPSVSRPGGSFGSFSTCQSYQPFLKDTNPAHVGDSRPRAKGWGHTCKEGEKGQAPEGPRSLILEPSAQQRDVSSPRHTCTGPEGRFWMARVQACHSWPPMVPK